MEHHVNNNAPSANESEQADLLAEAFQTLKSGEPYIVSHSGHGGHNHEGPVSLRRFEYKSHEVVIRTQYTITVDGQTVNAHISVDNKGRLNTHALPNYSFNSAVGMMKALIDCLPSSFSNR